MKVFIIAAVTADGYIARSTNELANWTSPEDKQHFTAMTKRAGIMVMGRTTYDTIGRPLPGRKTVVYTSRPLDNAEVETTQESPVDLLKRLEAAGFKEVAICGGAAIYSMFLQAGVVDELYLTVEPILFGQGVPLYDQALDIRLKLADVGKLNDDVLLVHYEVQK
ncbi:dihydrofolate reductase [soil metagenome]